MVNELGGLPLPVGPRIRLELLGWRVLSPGRTEQKQDRQTEARDRSARARRHWHHKWHIMTSLLRHKSAWDKTFASGADKNDLITGILLSQIMPRCMMNIRTGWADWLIDWFYWFTDLLMYLLIYWLIVGHMYSYVLSSDSSWLTVQACSREWKGVWCIESNETL